MRLFEDAPFPVPRRQCDDVCDWWLQTMADEADWNQWLGDHRELLRHVQRAFELRPGDRVRPYSLGGSPTPMLDGERPIQETRNAVRQPLREVHANVASTRCPGRTL